MKCALQAAVLVVLTIFTVEGSIREIEEQFLSSGKVALCFMLICFDGKLCLDYS